MKIRDTVWHVAIREKPVSTILEDKKTQFALVPNPFLGWAADPFIIEVDNTLYIFAELFSWIEWKGSIGYCIYKNGVFSPWKIVIKKEYHLSFPNVFTKNNRVYMIPEANRGKRLDILSARHFPDDWEIYRSVSKDCRYVDSIVLDEEHLLTYEIDNQSSLVLLEKTHEGKWAMLF